MLYFLIDQCRVRIRYKEGVLLQTSLGWTDRVFIDDTRNFSTQTKAEKRDDKRGDDVSTEQTEYNISPPKIIREY